ncbi:multidrug resistance efflux transporter family protein [Clostridium sp. SHJSY1]|uniref:DMT family transporter n=1 Tax=Clostridium sp. SHJSY1 TaxID=2942483 RepID=UPI0028769AD6|nr:multidrug resistance efflux transporter family protein [Clostridium sp. SHJSY1]MDS0525198.1 multidrug resistance efflux transporter family protein [Clostridium sp. SHJSY1]
MKKAFMLGIISSFFFAFTFVLNRSMNLSGGSWIWSASLRFMFALPIMALIVKKKYGFMNIHNTIKNHFKEWLIWSTIGFGLFYAPLSYAGDYGESWLIAASWQITIVMGVLLTPLFKRKIPFKNLCASVIILAGVFLLQLNNIENLNLAASLSTLLPILVAAISYPLGNRKMMKVCDDNISTIERVYGMILCSLPFWLILSIFGVSNVGLPSASQTVQAFCVALFSGIIATLLFFKATDYVKSNQKWLAVIESTQSGEVIFSLLGGILLLGDSLPDLLGLIGILLIIFGMILNSVLSAE